MHFVRLSWTLSDAAHKYHTSTRNFPTTKAPPSESLWDRSIITFLFITFDCPWRDCWRWSMWDKWESGKILKGCWLFGLDARWGLMLLPDMFWPALKGCSVFLVGKASKRGTTAHMYINYACSRESSLCCSLHSLQMDRFFLNNSLIKSFYLPIFRQLSATLINERDCSLERQQPQSGASWEVLPPPPRRLSSSFSRGM